MNKHKFKLIPNTKKSKSLSAEEVNIDSFVCIKCNQCYCGCYSGYQPESVGYVLNLTVLSFN